MVTLLPDGRRSLPFFLSEPMPCPYLSGRLERKIFTPFEDSQDASERRLSVLIAAGFRRSGAILYRPACLSCAACRPARINVSAFRWSRQMRRILRKNRDLEVSLANPYPTAEMFELFQQYQETRHPGGQMAEMSYEAFGDMLREGGRTAQLLQLREPGKAGQEPGKEGRLHGVMIADRVSDGFSAVYSFFQTQDPWRSLGTRLILALVQEAEKKRQRHVYLGYWIKETQKMAYKANLPGVEILQEGAWRMQFLRNSAKSGPQGA